MGIPRPQSMREILAEERYVHRGQLPALKELREPVGCVRPQKDQFGCLRTGKPS